MTVSRTWLEAEIRQSRMIRRPRALRPVEQSLGLIDRQVVDAGDPPLHVSFGVELPVLVAVRAEPLPRGVMPLVGEPHRDAVAGERPQFLDQPVVALLRPLALEELDDLGAASE